jgi:DNA adenine methylase
MDPRREVEMSQMRSLLKRHGGKYYLVRKGLCQILHRIPHRVFVEPFLGAGSVLLNMPRSEVEVAGDLDRGLMEVWVSMQDNRRNPFLSGLKACRFDRETFDAAKGWLESPQMVTRAIGYVVRNRMSRGAFGKDFAKCGTNPDGSPRLRGKRHPNGGLPDNESAWRSIVEMAPTIADWVSEVFFSCVPAETLICVWKDDDDALYYLDPPYMHDTRTVKDGYEHEMSAEQHEQLLLAALGTMGKFAISGYRNDMYDFYLQGCERIDWDLPNHSGQGKSKQRRVECLWIRA